MGKSECCIAWPEHFAALAVCSIASNSEGYCNHSLSFAVTTLGAPHEELLTQYLFKTTSLTEDRYLASVSHLSLFCS